MASPGRSRRSLPLSLALLLVLVPVASGTTNVGGALHGTGSATTFQIFANGKAVQGAGYAWTLACTSCDARFSFTTTSFVLVQDGTVSPLLPGAYELREYRGTIQFTQRAPGDFDVRLEGHGRINRL